jgi:hypothetical protein
MQYHRFIKINLFNRALKLKKSRFVVSLRGENKNPPRPHATQNNKQNNFYFVLSEFQHDSHGEE